MTEKRTPTEWCERTGIVIMDPDGWDRKNFEIDYEIPLTRDEFLGKAFLSTCVKWPHPLLDEEQLKWEPTGIQANIFGLPTGDNRPLRLPETEPSDVVDNVFPLDPGRNLFTAIDDLLATPEIAGLLDAAKAMKAIYDSLVEAGFTEVQALTLVGQMTAGRTQ